MRILVDEWPPYHFLSGKTKISGFATDVFKAVMHDMNLPFNLFLLPFDDVLQQVEQGDADWSFLAAKDSKRSTFAYFSMEPIYTSQWVLLTRKYQHHRVARYSDLDSLSIGVVKGYIYSDEFLKGINENNISLQIYANDSLNYQMLFVGRVDYVVGEKDNSLWFLKHNNLQKNIQVVPGFIIASNPLYFIWSKKRSTQKFADEFSVNLKKYKKTSSYKVLLKQYMGG